MHHCQLGWNASKCCCVRQTSPMSMLLSVMEAEENLRRVLSWLQTEAPKFCSNITYSIFPSCYFCCPASCFWFYLLLRTTAMGKGVLLAPCTWLCASVHAWVRDVLHSFPSWHHHYETRGLNQSQPARCTCLGTDTHTHTQALEYRTNCFGWKTDRILELYNTPPDTHSVNPLNKVMNTSFCVHILVNLHTCSISIQVFSLCQFWSATESGLWCVELTLAFEWM